MSARHVKMVIVYSTSSSHVWRSSGGYSVACHTRFLALGALGDKMDVCACRIHFPLSAFGALSKCQKRDAGTFGWMLSQGESVVLLPCLPPDSTGADAVQDNLSKAVLAWSLADLPASSGCAWGKDPPAPGRGAWKLRVGCFRERSFAHSGASCCESKGCSSNSSKVW